MRSGRTSSHSTGRGEYQTQLHEISPSNSKKGQIPKKRTNEKQNTNFHNFERLSDDDVCNW